MRCIAHAANIVRNRVSVQSVCYASHRKRICIIYCLTLHQQSVSRELDLSGATLLRMVRYRMHGGAAGFFRDQGWCAGTDLRPPLYQLAMYTPLPI